ncbi:MAG: glycosyltransferase family 87 protein [Chloroflexota bacterium]|nr:glycosyltransferase family 87 protein [Chloroflexota bacterium]
MREDQRFKVILTLFLAFRLMTLVTFLPEDLTRFGDYPYYYQLAKFSDGGHVPFIHYWSEHLPLFPFVSIGVYQLSRVVSGGGYHAYVYLFGALMVAFDTGSLYLFLRLARRLWSRERALQLGWTYSLLFAPFIFCWWTFEAMTAFFMLLALHLLVERQERLSAVAVGLGALTKLVPVLIIPAVVRTRPRRRWLWYVLVVGLVVVPVIGGLLWAGGPYAAASFRSLFSRRSYQTVWALVDGNLRTGLLGPPIDRFDLTEAAAPTGNPAVVPGWLRTGVFGLLGLLIFWRADLENSPRQLVAFVCLTVVLFFLWSKGWSPQWQVFLFPLVLLALPYRRAVLCILTLSLVSLAEWPVLLSRGMNEWLYITVPLRSGLLVLLALDLWKHLHTK